ncbi:resistance to phytophthora 1 [Striga asiatica]|uniref:Resistance to phytophthora 1 n=1 Tax=Striga asiatica TaxID=4170 RepID=A0A5A7P1V3_STRAF|nr:resistance to phytophthora 1 [Striga asiatica]
MNTALASTSILHGRISSFPEPLIPNPRIILIRSSAPPPKGFRTRASSNGLDTKTEDPRPPDDLQQPDRDQDAVKDSGTCREQLPQNICNFVSDFVFTLYLSTNRELKMENFVSAHNVVQKTAATFAPRASTATKNPAVPGTVLYAVFEVQGYVSLLLGGALSFNLIFPSNEPDIWRLMGMWSIWMFIVWSADIVAFFGMYAWKLGWFSQRE